MNPDTIKSIIEALKSGDGEAALTLLEGLLTELAGGTTDSIPPGDDAAAAAADPPQPDPAKMPPGGAAANSKELTEALAKIAKLEERNEELDTTARKELVAELVKLGVETPATAWQRDAKGKPTGKLVARLTVEPITEMRERVAALRSTAPRRPTPPEVTDDSEEPELSPVLKAQLAKLTPTQREKFERNQAALAKNRKASK